MPTTAAVWFEKLDKTIFVGMDGYPSHMLPELKRIVETDVVELVTETSDYRFLGENYLRGNAHGDKELPHGVAYREQGQPLTVTLDKHTHAPMFYDGEKLASPDHKYTVTKSGVIIAHHRY